MVFCQRCWLGCCTIMAWILRQGVRIRYAHWIKILFFVWSVVFVVLITEEMLRAARSGVEVATSSIHSTAWSWLTEQSLYWLQSWIAARWASSSINVKKEADMVHVYEDRVPEWGSWYCWPWGCSSPTTRTTTTTRGGFAGFMGLVSDAVAIHNTVAWITR
mgnify:CR=1 FL=1